MSHFLSIVFLKYNNVRKYDDANTVQIKIKLNYNTDSDIIEYLNNCGNKQGTIKKLIREEISRGN